jgi:GNAT superfamily N-acetyltransferase
MALPAGYEFQAPTPDDLQAVADVLIADQIDVAGQYVLGSDFIGEVWSRLDFDLANNAWAVIDPSGTIVAYGQVTPDAPGIVESWGVVHPKLRGQGIGSTLFDRMGERASELLAGSSDARFRTALNADDHAAATMVGDRGLRLVRHFWHMQIDLTGPVDPGPPPEGIEVTGIDPCVDLNAVHAVLVDAFAEDWSHHPEPFDRWLEEETRSPHHDPTLWFLAWDEGEPVATLTAGAGEDGGSIDYVAVLNPYRGRGIAAALLRRAFAELADRGVDRAVLNVDAENPTGATTLYEHVGMRVANRWDLWERSLGRAGSAQ